MTRGQACRPIPIPKPWLGQHLWWFSAGVDSEVFSGPLGPLDDYFTDIEGQEEDET